MNTCVFLDLVKDCDEGNTYLIIIRNEVAEWLDGVL